MSYKEREGKGPQSEMNQCFWNGSYVFLIPNLLYGVEPFWD